MNPTILPQYPGDAGTIQALTIMKQMVEDCYLHPYIRERAAVLADPCRRNQECEHSTFLNFVRNAISYVSDPLTTEVLADPVSFIERRLRSGQPVYGDCAQMAPYLACLLKTAGHDPKFKVIGSEDNFSHVFISCEGAELDPTEPVAPDLYERFMLIDL